MAFSEVQIYDLSYIHLHSSTSAGMRTMWPALIGLIAQFVEHFTGIAKVIGSSPFQAWIIIIIIIIIVIIIIIIIVIIIIITLLSLFITLSLSLSLSLLLLSGFYFTTA